MNHENIKICISSCKLYSEKTIPCIVNSLIQSGINTSDILIVEGGWDVKSSTKENDIQYIKVNHNSFDLTSFIEIIESNIESDYWLLLHDTCRVGKNFKNIIDSFELNFEKMSVIHGSPSMSIGIYKHSYLIKHKDLILSYKNIDYSSEGIRLAKLKAGAGEDVLFKLTDCDRFSMGVARITQPVDINWYPTNTHRLQEYFPQLDLYKLKGNWGQSGDTPITTV